MTRNVHVPFLGERQWQHWPLTRLRAVVPERLKCAGTHVGRVAVKAAGTFTIATKHGKVTDVPHRYCRPLHRSDGYTYHQGVGISPPPTSPKGAPVSAPA